MTGNTVLTQLTRRISALLVRSCNADFEMSRRTSIFRGYNVYVGFLLNDIGLFHNKAFIKLFVDSIARMTAEQQT